MAAERNLSRIRQSCERIAAGDPESGERPLITMEDCYTIDGNRYMKTEKYERKKFGQTRVEKVNEYTLEYRKRQKNLLIRRGLINDKFNEIITDIQSGIVSQEKTEKKPEVTKPTSSVDDMKRKLLANKNLQQKINGKNVAQIRELMNEIEMLKKKIDKNTIEYTKQINKYKELGEKEKLIRNRLNLKTWDDFIKKTEDNKFEYKLDKLLELLDENTPDADDMEGNENLLSDLEDKTVNDDEGTASRREEDAKKAEEAKKAAEQKAKNNTETKSNFIKSFFKEGFENPKSKLEKLNETIGRKLAVYENIGKIRVEGSPILGARANKIILNSIELVSDFETFTGEVIASIRDRYYNDENVDYKKLVDQTRTIDDNYVKRDLLGDANHFSKKSYEIELNRKSKLDSKTRLLGIITSIIFIIASGLVGLFIRL